MDDERLYENLMREEITPASKSLRFIAWFIDMFLLSCVFTFINLYSFMQLYDVIWNLDNVDYEALMASILSYMLYILLLKIVYDTFFIALYGSSIGKIICKIRVININIFDKPHFFHALLRAFSKYIGESLLFITYIFGFGDALGRTIHDRIAKTVVVRY